MEEIRIDYLTRGYFWEVILNNHSGEMAARIREGRPNPTAPACRPSSILNNGALYQAPSNFVLILPHDLSIKRYSKKTERYHKKKDLNP